MSRIFKLPRQVVIDGGVASGAAEANFYLTGTTTRTDTYSDSTLATAHANPVIADSSGVFPVIYLDPDIVYRLILNDSASALIYDEDPIQDALTQANIGLIANPRTPAEISAGVTPVDYSYIEGFTLRYGNLSDGNGNGGGTDNSTALQNWLNVGAQGVLLTGEAGIYRCDTPLLITDNAIHMFTYGVVIDFSNNTTTLAKCLTITGSATGTTTTATANIAQGATAITVSNEAGFSGWMTIESNTELLGARATYIKGELAEISSTSSNTINIFGGAKTSYDQASPTVTLTALSMLSQVVVRGLKIIGSGTSSNRHIGLQVAYAVAPLIIDCEIVDCSSTGIDFNRCSRPKRIGCDVINCNDITGPTGYAYSDSMFTEYSIVDSCGASRCRHAYTTAGLLPVWGSVVSSCSFSNQLEGQVSGYVSPHANGIGGSYTNNSVDNAYSGFVMRGPRNTVNSNTVTNNLNACISFIEDGAQDTVCNSNNVFGRIGITASGLSGSTHTFKCDNNNINGTVVNGLAIDAGMTLSIANATANGNTIRDHTHGIRLDGDDSAAVGNHIFNVTTYGLRVLSGSRVKLKDNDVQTPSSSSMINAVLIDAAATDTKVMNNDFSGATGNLIQDNGTTTTQGKNTLDGVSEFSVQTFTSTDATPTVLSGRNFITAGTTAITDFDDGVVGQTIHILAAASITITDGSAIILNGSANYAMTATDTLTLTMFNDQVWQEVGRSVN